MKQGFNVRKDFSLMVQLEQQKKNFANEPNSKNLQIWLTEICNNCSAANWRSALKTTLYTLGEIIQ